MQRGPVERRDGAVPVRKRKGQAGVMKTTAACTFRGFVRGKRHVWEGMAETLERPESDFEVNCGDRDTEQSGMYGLADAGLCEPCNGG